MAARTTKVNIFYYIRLLNNHCQHRSLWKLIIRSDIRLLLISRYHPNFKADSSIQTGSYRVPVSFFLADMVCRSHRVKKINRHPARFLETQALNYPTGNLDSEQRVKKKGPDNGWI